MDGYNKVVNSICMEEAKQKNVKKKIMQEIIFLKIYTNKKKRKTTFRV